MKQVLFRNARIFDGVCAKMMMMQGRPRRVAAGARADLPVVDGDALKDISLPPADGGKLRAIVRGGALIKVGL
jgi:imidazolonepropionase-like amidohydrolase